MTALRSRQSYRVVKILHARTSGPGGFYNIGNALGLVSGLAISFFRIPETTGTAISRGLTGFETFLLGSQSALCLSLAMLIFFWSGEQYHRAWIVRDGPDIDLVRQGDIWSGIGALFLGVGLLILNHPVLAATAGGIHALGKFGSAFSGGRFPLFWPGDWPNIWRSSVAASRFPAILAALFDTTAHLRSGDMLGLTGTIVLVLCYLVWLKADLKLL